jgi:hypothetical protein
LEQKLVQSSGGQVAVPTDRGCSDEEHAAQRGEIPVHFKG